MAVDNENADPVGTPVSEEVRKAGRSRAGRAAPSAPVGDPAPRPRDLHQQQDDFTAEGAPPPGKVGPAEPVTDAGPRRHPGRSGRSDG